MYMVANNHLLLQFHGLWSSLMVSGARRHTHGTHTFIQNNKRCLFSSLVSSQVSKAMSHTQRCVFNRQSFCFCFFFKIYLLYLYEYTVAVFRHTRRGHQLLLTNGCEPPCGCWELNSGPLGEQSVLLTTEPPLQPQLRFFFLTAY